MRFRTNKIIEKNKQGKKGLGLGLVYPSAEAIERSSACSAASILSTWTANTGCSRRSRLTKCATSPMAIELRHLIVDVAQQFLADNV